MSLEAGTEFRVRSSAIWLPIDLVDHRIVQTDVFVGDTGSFAAVVIETSRNSAGWQGCKFVKLLFKAENYTALQLLEEQRASPRNFLVEKFWPPLIRRRR